MPKRAVRIDEDLDGQMRKTAKERGYRTPSAFIRAAIESEVKSRNEMAGMEAQTAASFDRVSQELRRVQRDQQALFTLVDALTRKVRKIANELSPRMGSSLPIQDSPLTQSIGRRSKRSRVAYSYTVRTSSPGKAI
jgi:hypothetical protein